MLHFIYQIARIDKTHKATIAQEHFATIFLTKRWPLVCKTIIPTNQPVQLNKVENEKLVFNH